MKHYTVPQLKSLAQKQGYKIAALEDSGGQRLLPFNQAHKKTISKHLEEIPKRLDPDFRPDGVYYVLMAYNIQGSKNPERFPIVKGKVSPDELAEVEKKSLPLTRVEVVPHQESVRSWNEALADKEKIATQHAEIESLKIQLNAALKENEELHAELEEQDDKADGLAEGAQAPVNPVVSYLKETVPSFLPLIDRLLDQRDKALDLKARQLNGNGKHAPEAQKTPRMPRREVATGSESHLNLIRSLAARGDDDRMNIELDKLEAANPDLYNSLIAELGLEDEGNDPQEGEQQQ